jgi:cytochrome c oxidase assembly protein subunit 15
MSNSAYNAWLHRFAKFVAGATFILIFVGGLVTSTDSGLAVPDWPTTYGQFMFSFPLSQMVGGIFYEHGHRMVASIVGMLMVILAVWLWLKEPRRWVRRLGWLALFAVVLQGLLGGLTVLFLLPTAISVSHGALAQIFFCLTICLALFTSKEWQQVMPRENTLTGRSKRPVSTPNKIADTPRPPLQSLTVMTTAAVFIQLILGAVMRHTKSGLAIPDFPLAFGKIIPPFDSAKIAIHFSHRLGALVVSALIIWTAARIIKNHRGEKKFFRPAVVLLCALAAQLTLGAFTVWTQKEVLITTAHVATGALILGTTLFLALRTRKLFVTQPPGHIAETLDIAAPEMR